MATVLKVPLASPTPDSQPKPQAALTADQEEKYNWLLEQVKNWKEVPATEGKAGPITDREKFWLTRECLLRFLRATKWNQKEAEKRILGTLTWRREYGVEELTADHISPENETGKQIILGYDKEGRVCHYLNPGRQNTEASPRQVQHLVFMLERVIDLMPPQVETLSLLINFKSSKSRSNTAPGIGQAREVLNILQNHYPERLGRALIINVPWIVNGFFKLITPFIDPNTREKLKFNEDMKKYVPAEQLWTEFNGSLEFDYDHATYWPALQKMCVEKREAKYQRWVAGGQQIGELEDFITGHAQVGVAGPIAAATSAPEPTPAASAPAPAAEPETILAPEPALASETALAPPPVTASVPVATEAHDEAPAPAPEAAAIPEPTPAAVPVEEKKEEEKPKVVASTEVGETTA
ncbi:CRAL/TRIO domain-containing protein [Neurospora crassa]|uniref:CRAL/TRIO domain-containing protein n=2 Tax=Neurospora crassa TaxID=5141 RepID=Q1K7S5_NEUCR|nr:CRAL/TRIO domain-containing protein [Neurospora crassa OR74A]EAA32087.1 CRAL/TRIO domain-containing protein [Neurospora crassa OR74A]KHE88804.1 CRAL/TRIO domain-containing protein [Neurospora crassa]CAD21271.1 related to PDR16 protein [Neurospora crassa]|eukprot:XP_961323.1 CRAL/TRIO domain-containing protein [Neurospora crassa OR74A]